MPSLDAATIGELYDAHGAAVFRRCRDILGDEQAALDATQDVFVKALAVGGGFRGEASPTTWLYRITTNLCLNRLRDQRGRRAKLEGARGDAEGDGEASGAVFGSGLPSSRDMERRALVRSLLEQADGEARQVAIAYYFDGLTHEEIGDLMGLSRPTVRKRLEDFTARARRQLGLKGDGAVALLLALAALSALRGM